MSKYFSFLRKKRSPSLTDEAGEVIGSSVSPGGKLRKHKGKKGPPHNVDDGFCDQRFSLQNYDFYEADSEDVKVSSEGNSMHSDNDSLLDNLSYGEVCSSEGDKSLHWEKVETLTDDSRPSSSSESPRHDSNADSITLCENKVNNTSQEEDEGLANEKAEDYFSFDHKDLVEQMSLPELMEVDVRSHLIDDFMDEAFDDLEGVDEDIIGDQEDCSSETSRAGDTTLKMENVEHAVVTEDEPFVDSSSNTKEVQQEIIVSDQDTNSTENKHEEIVNALSSEDLMEGQTRDVEIVAKVLEKMTNHDENLSTSSTEVDPHSNDVENVTAEVSMIVTQSNNSEGSPPFSKDISKTISDDDIPPSDTDQEEKQISGNVSDHHDLVDDTSNVTTCNDTVTQLVTEKSIGCETDLDSYEQEVIGSEEVKENLAELASQEDENRFLLQKGLTDYENCVDESHGKSDEVAYSNANNEPIVETEIKETFNTDFSSEENLRHEKGNSTTIQDEINYSIASNESLPIEFSTTEEVIEQDEASLLTKEVESSLLAIEPVKSPESPEKAVSINVQETVNPPLDTKEVGENLVENIISIHDKDYQSDNLSPDKGISAIGELEILSTSELENISEIICNQTEEQNFSNVISDKDIPPAQFPVENKNKVALGNSDRTAISVSTGTHSEFDDEFDSAKEDLTDDEADIVYDTHEGNLTIEDNSKHFSDSFEREMFEATKESEPSLSVFSDNKINADEVGGDESDTLLVPNCVTEVEKEMQEDVPDNSCVVSISCDDSIASLNNIGENAKNIQSNYRVSKGDDALEEDTSNALGTDDVVANCNQSTSEVIGAIVQSTIEPVVSCDINEIVIACDEALIPSSSSQISLNDSIAKDYDTTESSVETNCTIPKDDSDLLDEESVFPVDVSSPSVVNERITLQGTAADGIEINDGASSGNELKFATQLSEVNSDTTSSPSKKHTTSVSSDENFLFGHSDHVEAEARLAQRRAARAEARELRLRELEKQQLDQDDNEDEQQYAANSFAPADKKLQNAAPTPPRTNTPYIPKSSPRGVSVTRASAVRSSSLANSTGSGGGGQFSRRSSEDSTPDDALPLSSRELKAELKELEEKFRKAMITNAQLDNEKATLTYEVEFLKDKYSDLEESHNQLTKEHKKKSSENETLRKLTNKLKEEVKMVRKVLQERDSLIQEYGLVLIGEENGEEENYDDREHDAEMEDDTINDLSPRKIGVKKALLSTEASELLSKGAAQGSLDVRLKKYAERKNDLEDEVRRLKLELEEELSKRRKENGLDYEKQKEASKSINEYKFRVQKAEAEVSTLQANVARLESLVTRYKASSEELEKSEEDLKSEKRRLQRELRDITEKCNELESSKGYVKRQYEKLLHERGKLLENKSYLRTLREAQNRLEELELTTSHLQKRFDKLKTARSTLLKDLSQDPV